MSSTTRLLRRRASYGVAGALAAATLAVTATSPAQAADALTLKWGVSQYLNEHLTSQSFTNGATEDASGVVTFVGGSSTRSASGAVSTSYTGTARYAFNNPSTGAELYSVTFSDPQVVVDADGRGRILSDVSWTVPGAAAGGVSDTVVTTFTTSSLSGTTLNATPDWAGVAPADTYGSGKPVDGKSWAVPFVKAVPSSINSFFYASGSNPTSDAKKFPAVVAAQVPALVPTTRVTTTSTSATTGLTLRVDGTNFTPVTQAGDAGVYAGLAPSGGMPDVSTQAGMSAFAASAWVMPAQFTNGAFTTTLTAPANALDPARSYSVYTWQAHSHSNTTQDTETPVTIDWAALRPTAPTPPAATPATAPVPPVPTSATTTVRASWKSKATTTRAGKLKVSLANAAGAEASGPVKVVLKKNGATRKLGSTTVRNGAATITVPRLTRGTWKVVLTYGGQAGSAPAKKTMKLVVR